MEDARKAVALDALMVKGYVRIAKCGIALGDLTTVEQALNKVKELDALNSTIATEVRTLEIMKQHENDSNVAYEKKDFRKVVFCMDRILDHAPTCSRYKVKLKITILL